MEMFDRYFFGIDGVGMKQQQQQQQQHNDEVKKGRSNVDVQMT